MCLEKKSVLNSFLYSGLGEIDSSCSHISKYAYFAYKVWMLVTMCILAITVFADIYANMDNLSITTDDGCIFAGIFVVIFKAMNLQIHRGKMKKLLHDIFECGDDLCEFSGE
ncbi:uncharacterized protein LOC102672232 isoform X2 [Apis dorsata]|uniref:uncharacterized protein LOC102672232 isoform X2 n=1 Tax=Apis dorsata TaxID=7462 RepID=UPI0003DF7458|nr:uncharacterized protein LOC102672232 isoform X2 [Apis dorsata]